MRSLVLLALFAACAHGHDGATRIAVEDSKKQILFELEKINGRLAAIEEKQQKLEQKIDARPAAAAPARPSGPDPQKVYAYPIGDAPVRGKSDAWVTLVEISDFQCPFCQRVQATLDELVGRYSDDLRVVYKHNPLPFHERAMPAAIAAECAREQQRFWELHDLLWANNRALGDEEIAGYAKQVKGLDMRKWQKCYDGAAPKERIESDQVVASNFGARGTPAFFINGRFLSGAQPAAAFRLIIDEELQKAKASGIPRQDYYRKAVLEGGAKGE
jgi:protein-disulfide isomerase